jgi:hypothetical protein
MLGRTGLRDGALSLLIEEFIENTRKFIVFLERLEELRRNCQTMAMGTMSPMIPDHMIREHSYYIAKIEENMNI